MTTSLFRHTFFGFLNRRWLLFFWELSVLNVVFRLSSDNYYAFGYWVALSGAIGLSWLARRYRLPALKYFAAGGIATAIFILGLEVGRDLARNGQANHPASPVQHPTPATEW